MEGFVHPNPRNTVYAHGNKRQEPWQYSQPKRELRSPTAVAGWVEVSLRLRPELRRLEPVIPAIVTYGNTVHLDAGYLPEYRGNHR